VIHAKLLVLSELQCKGRGEGGSGVVHGKWGGGGTAREWRGKRMPPPLQGFCQWTTVMELMKVVGFNFRHSFALFGITRPRWDFGIV